MIKSGKKRFSSYLLIVFILLPFIVNAAASDIPVNVKVNYINQQLKNITLALGKKESSRSTFELENVSTREAYYALLALYDKANRFNFEVTGIYVTPPKSIANVTINDVESLLDDIIVRIDQASDHLKIKKAKFLNPAHSTNIITDESFNKILDANIQMENILYQKTAPRQVYKDVIQANQDILALLPPDQKITKVVVKGYKTPADVYGVLLKCANQLSIYANKTNHKIATVILPHRGINKNQIHPNNVLNLAKFIVSETSYLRSFSTNKKVEYQDVYVSYKTPTNVYYEALTLLENLKKLNSITVIKLDGLGNDY